MTGGPAFELTDDWVAKVANNPDDEFRAHQIILTLSYVAVHLDDLIHQRTPESRLESRPRLSDVTGTNANWFHFATWANMTVTTTLRADGAPQRAAGGLAAPLRRRLTPGVLQARASQGQRVGRALTWGQRLIFLSTCLTLLEFDERLQANTSGRRFIAGDVEKCERARRIMEMTNWEGRNWSRTSRHMAPMWRAFELYELARITDDRAARARLVLGANLLLTAVDQDLVNPALKVVVDNIPQRVGVRWTGGWRGWPSASAACRRSSRTPCCSRVTSVPGGCSRPCGRAW